MWLIFLYKCKTHVLKQGYIFFYKYITAQRPARGDTGLGLLCDPLNGDGLTGLRPGSVGPSKARSGSVRYMRHPNKLREEELLSSCSNGDSPEHLSFPLSPLPCLETSLSLSLHDKYSTKSTTKPPMALGDSEKRLQKVMDKLYHFPKPKPSPSRSLFLRNPSF